MRERNAKRCALLGRRAHCSSFRRSSSDKVSSFKGRPVFIIVLQLGKRFYPQTQLEDRLFNEFLIQDTSNTLRVPVEREGFLTREGVPYLHRSTITRAGQPLAIAAKCHALDISFGPA